MKENVLTEILVLSNWKGNKYTIISLFSPKITHVTNKIERNQSPSPLSQLQYQARHQEGRREPSQSKSRDSRRNINTIT